MPIFLDFQTMKRIRIESVSWGTDEEEDGSKHAITSMAFGRTRDKASTALFKAAINGEMGNALVTLGRTDGKPVQLIKIKTAVIDNYSIQDDWEDFTMKFIMAVFQQ